jgi:tetratricopeptide (TPR) repeat protein
MVIVTRIRREVLALPAAELGPDNPLPALRPRDDVHRVDDRGRAGMPDDMARQLGHAPLHSLLPVPVRDGYGRNRRPRGLDALVIENDRLRATVLPGLGGRIASLVHLATGRELLYRNPVFQPADFALNGAWFSGGIEWNIGATGHTTLSCAPLHAARVPAPDGGEMLRLWEWERLRDLPFQVDLWLPEGSDFLYAGVRIRNPHERPVPTYWWSNTAVPEDRRILAPAEEAWYFGYDSRLRRVPVPSYDGIDRTRPRNSPYAADWFYEVPDGRRRWIAAVDADGHGLVQTSTDVLRGRKLFVWGSGPGGRRWQEWLTEPGTGGYCEIQAGLARTQLEHVPLAAQGEVSWLEAYGPLDTPSAGEWADVVGTAERRLAAVLPRTQVDEVYEAWRPYADTEPGTTLATGSGWGALEVLRAGLDLPGTPFSESALGDAQEPWRQLLRTGALPAPDPGRPPGPTLVAPPWRDLLETAPATPHTEYHLGIAQWHAGDRAQAVRSWERALRRAPAPWPALRCLAVADQEAGHHERAADRYADAFGALCREGHDDGGTWTAALAALGRETLEALLRVRRAADARSVWQRLPAAVRRRGRFRLLLAELLLAEGRRTEARAVFDAGFEVADLREGSDDIARSWARLTDEPLPGRYDFRMRPDTG